MTCAHCGTELPATALFCGECGRSLAAARPGAQTSSRSDTAIIDNSDREALEAAEIDGATVVSRSTPMKPQQPAPQSEPVLQAEPAPHPEPTPDPWKAPPTAAVRPPITVRDPSAPVHDPWMPPARLLRAPDPVVEHDLENTRIVSSTLSGQRFVLQFSTGESVTIFGTGIVGRNPSPEPAEYFDHIVTIVDPGKSVSKTHLEFGQVAGSFWVSDRFSGNGTVIREPDAAPRRCEPGKRYRVARGTRVTMGEQFFVVS